MADDVDRGNETAEQTLAGYINRVRASLQHEHLTPSGECYNCGEALPEHLIFCSAECRADYDYRKSVRRRTRI